jgi:hypothetical protein
VAGFQPFDRGRISAFANTRLGPPTRTVDVIPRVDDAPIDTDAQTDAALLALVQLLARQAAREMFEQSVTSSDRSFDEGCE